MNSLGPFYAAFLGGALLRRMLAYATVVFGFDALHSATWSGVFYLCLLLPYLLFSLPAGGLIDEQGVGPVLRRAVVVAVIALLLATALLHYGGAPAPDWRAWLLAALLFLYGAVYAVAYTAFIAAIPTVTDAVRVSRTTVILNVLAIVTLAYAPPLVGALREAMSWPWLFAMLTIIGTVSAVSVRALRFKPLPSSPSTRPPGNLGELIRYCRTHPKLPLLLALTLAFSGVVVGPLEVLLPQFAERILHLGPFMAGVFIAVGGSGLVVGALLALRVLHRGQTEAWLCGSGAAGSALLLVMTAVPGPLTFLFVFLSGVMGGVFSSLNIASVQACASDQNRGRVMGLFALIVGGVPGLGGVIAGVLSATVGPAPAMRAVYVAAIVAFGLLYLRARTPRIAVAQA